MLPEAFELRERMLVPHKNSEYHTFPDKQIFIDNPGKDRFVCGSESEELLRAWFGEFMESFLNLGGHIGVYEVPDQVIRHDDGRQVVYQQKQAKLISRTGTQINSIKLIEKIHPTKKPTQTKS